MAPVRKRKSSVVKNKTSIVKTIASVDNGASASLQDDSRVKSGGKKGSPVPRKTISAKRTDGQKPSRAYNVAQLLEKAEGFLDTFEYELAEKFCLRALEMDPSNPDVNATYGAIMTELEDFDKARSAYRRSIEQKPDGDYRRYLSYAQLEHGEVARDAYVKAISMMQAELSQTSPSDKSENEEGDVEQAQADLSSSSCCAGEGAVEQLKSDLSSSCCAVAELYMTDLCFESDAEKECLRYIQYAIAADESNPEGYQSMANYHLVKSDTEQAKAFLEKSLGLWLEDHKRADLGDADDPNLDPVLPCPLAYSARVSAAKMCLELDMWQEGSDVLDSLIAENDEDEETWYLLGYLNYLRGEVEHLLEAKICFTRAVSLMKKKSDVDADLLQSAENLLIEVRANPAVPDSDDDFDVDGDDGAAAAADVSAAMRELGIESSGEEEEEDDANGDES